VASSADVAAIKVVVDALPTDVASSADVAAIKVVVDALPTDVASATALATVATAVFDLRTVVDSLPTGTDVAAIKAVVDALPTDVASATDLEYLHGIINALPTDVASSEALGAVATAIANLRSVVDSLPTDVASGTALAALSTKLDSMPATKVTLGVGYSMNVTQHRAIWLPAQLTNKTTGAGVTGISFDSVAVSYQKSGEPVKTKTLTAEQWSEGVEGAYSIYFLSDELDTLGTFHYWVEQSSSVIYPGMAQVTESNAGPGSLEKTIRVTVKGQPVKDCEVWVTTDEAGKDKIAGTRLTDILGLVSFMLDPGIYWVHWIKSREVEYSKRVWEVKANA